MLGPAEEAAYYRVKNAVLNNEEFKEQKAYLKSGPLLTMLPIGQTCNLKCQMCPIDRNSSFACSNISLEEIKKFLPIVGQSASVALYDQGEPLTNPDYEKILDYVQECHPGIVMYTSTNGTFLNKYWRTKIVTYGYVVINISVNAGTNYTYFKIMGKDALPTVMYNVRELVRERGENELPKILLSFVLQKDNVHELPLFVSQAVDLGVDGVPIWDLIQYSPAHAQFAVTEKDLTSVYLEAKKIADKNNLPILTFADIPYFDLKYDSVCRDPWQTMRVNPSGEVRTCCYNAKSYGNVFKQSFEEIWNSPEYQELRATVNSENMLEVCKKCPRKINC